MKGVTSCTNYKSSTTNAVNANVVKAATAAAAVAKLVRISVRRKMGRDNLSEKFLPKFMDKYPYQIVIASILCEAILNNNKEIAYPCGYDIVGKKTLLAMTKIKGEQNDPIPHPHS